LSGIKFKLRARERGKKTPNILRKLERQSKEKKMIGNQETYIRREMK
jgi:hypothetical protein